ncbi:acyl-CoA dehydrogenase C-terminal domain-containing protein [Oceanicoccus sagamiensis]|uniref:3-methylmercaptopropionyl-CoA dehydrogenase n=1 Tax=Oceanicoccus sagamiensis TaxID=716816 RepID=A0A1X9NKR2_9GAMM|nr:acyl-CoA dehydrogenase C-terminal domain-containing protein [Oceanicoccus sagamiensis]ARN76019.1 acyl-CoA dehydrogenase [Oceanicoccus sagamiensis]
MSQYKAPLRDLEFVRNELLGMDSFYASNAQWNEVSNDLSSAILEECAKFCENVLTPLNSVGDEQGCTLKDGKVTTPDGFKEAYQQFVEGGWPSLEAPEEFGGQGLPKSLALAATEMVGTANWSWGMYPGLSRGACHTITEHGTDEQKATYLHKLTDGSWTGTMCLTEPHCGSDLGLLRTKAEPNDDGSYNISGTKIFISSGDHDMAENIVHIVLARLPDAPKGTKGISLFIVPKFNVNADGSVGERNTLECGSLEHKMGIHGNATCVMNFDDAKGYLIGPENRGLNCMFTFMNTARIGTAIQGLAHAELSYQNSLAYAEERLQMRALSGAKAPEKAADPIIVHPDVRRMLLTQKAFSEGGRMLIYYIALFSDISAQAKDDEEKERFENLLAMLTPIAKAFMTETGFEAANLGMQIFGGHGYIAEWGMEQNVRDSRISMLYEGTTGIQSLDLLGRKVIMSGGKLLQDLITPISEFCDNTSDDDMAEFINPLKTLLAEWQTLTEQIGASAMSNPDEVNAACVDYLMYSGYVIYAFLFARSAKVSKVKLAEGTTEQAFYEAKVYLARFYFQRLLPRTASLALTMTSGVENLLDDAVNPF